MNSINLNSKESKAQNGWANNDWRRVEGMKYVTNEGQERITALPPEVKNHVEVKMGSKRGGRRGGQLAHNKCSKDRPWCNETRPAVCVPEQQTKNGMKKGMKNTMYDGKFNGSITMAWGKSEKKRPRAETRKIRVCWRDLLCEHFQWRWTAPRSRVRRPPPCRQGCRARGLRREHRRSTSPPRSCWRD